jgi:aspartate aminotransferase
MTNVQAQMTSNPATILQAAAEGALNGIQSYVESLRLMIENNRNVIMAELKSFNGIHVPKPEGAFYCLPDFRAYQENSVELADFLLKKALVVTVPGKEFGIEGHLRLSFSGTVKEITEGITRMKWALDPEAPHEIYIGDRKMIRDWL